MEYIFHLLTKYFNKKLSQLIGFNCIERRNFGFLLAKKLGAEIIATIDDDNIPKKLGQKPSN